jgi:hypothetical protein
MGPAAVTMRCPSCGRELRAVVAPSPPTQWFPCPSCHVPVPVVVPRDLPPLYSWEVVPGLYPRLAVPRRPRWRTAAVASIALAVAAALAAVVAGVLGVEGFVAAEPARYVVSGTVYQSPGGSSPVPVAGATVVLSVDGSAYATVRTGAGGAFRFANVPDGGLELNVTAVGFGPTDVYTFACRSYAAQTQGLGVELLPGGADNATVEVLTPFGDLETLLAYVGGGGVLAGVGGVAAGMAAVLVCRPGGGVAGVIGAGAAVAVPVVLFLLSIPSVYPDASFVAAGAGGAGGFALVLATADLASRGSGPAPSGTGP